MTEVKAQLAPLDKPHDRGRANQGINAAVRDLGIDRTEAQRSVKIAGLPDEAKEAARDLGLDRNQSALLAAARAPATEVVSVIREIADRKFAKPVPEIRCRIKFPDTNFLRNDVIC